VILRDPAERAISHYEMEKSRGYESLPLWRGLWSESKRLVREAGLGHAHRCHSYVDRGLYAEQIAHLRSHFNDEQILIIENDALKNQHAATIKKVAEFLAIDATLSIASERVFSGDYRKKHLSIYYAAIKFLLRWRFREANKQLKQQLIEMGVNPNWRWLK
jgi:hypothetical protein